MKKIIPGTLAPWTARGPGWANAGCTFTMRDTATMKDQSHTLYAEHFDGALLDIAVTACAELERQAQKALISRKAGR